MSTPVPRFRVWKDTDTGVTYADLLLPGTVIEMIDTYQTEVHTSKEWEISKSSREEYRWFHRGVILRQT